MPAFEYAALDANGRTKKGILEGDSGRLVREALRDQGLSPIRVSPTRRRLQGATQGRKFDWWKRIKPLEVAVTTRQMATLVSAGLPIEEALLAISRQSTNRKINAIYMSVRDSVLGGQSLAVALGEFPGTFSTMFRSTVAAGEQSGHLDIVLENLANYLEDRFNTRRDVEMALFYPLLLFVTAVVIVGLLLTYVIPDIVQVFENTGAELPAITRFLIGTSEILNQYSWLILLGLGAVGILGYFVFKQSIVRRWWDRVKIRTPGVSWLVRGTNTARFASTLAILTRSGVPLVEGMHIANEVLTSFQIRKALERAENTVREGTSLYEALSSTGQFPPIFLHMVQSGEASGSLAEMLSKSAQFQQEELKRTVTTIVELVRPLILLFMAGVVLVIMLAILLPILNMNQLVL
ncbi:MAG: type II secretion system inner membrane protein GspF [Gammaproteobacteria bacterium]|nr:type II secretion system inner membrane protein GspF [Gammaproteobacteria bacterium]